MKSKLTLAQLRQVNRKGFTLAEILVAATISVLVVGALYSMYLISAKAYKQSVSQAELTQNARISLERISRDLRQADRIVTLLPIDDTDQLNPPPSQIQFRDGHYTEKIRYLIYSLENNNLHRKVVHYYFSSDPNIWVIWNAQDQYGNLPQQSVDEDAIKADKIDSLKFYGEKVITIEIKVKANNQEYSFKTSVLGRNL